MKIRFHALIFLLFSLGIHQANGQNCSNAMMSNPTPEDPAIIDFGSGTTDNCLKIAFPLDLHVTSNSTTDFEITAFKIEGTLETTNLASAQIDADLTESLLPFPFTTAGMNDPILMGNVTMTITGNTFLLELADISPNSITIPNGFINSDPYLKIFVDAQDGVSFPGDIYLNHSSKEVTFATNTTTCDFSNSSGETPHVVKAPPANACSSTTNPVSVTINNLGTLINTAEEQIITFTADQAVDGYMDFYLEVVDEFGNLSVNLEDSEDDSNIRLKLNQNLSQLVGSSKRYYFEKADPMAVINSGAPLFKIIVTPQSTIIDELRVARFENMASRVRVNGDCCLADINLTSGELPP